MKKRFLNHLFLFILPIIIFTLFVEFYYRTQTAVVAKRKYIENNSKNTELLFLGSSHIAQGINPEYLKKNTMNLANSGQVLPIDYYLFERYIYKMPKVKMVIVEISPLALYSDFVEGDQMAYLYSNLWDIKYKVDSSSYKNYTILFSAFKLYALGFLNAVNPLNNETVEINKYGFTQLPLRGNKFYNLKYDTTSIENLFIMPHNFKRKEHFRNSKKFLKKIANECKQKSIKVIFLTTPYYKTYYTHIPEVTKNEINAMVNTFVKNYGVIYLDLSDGSKIKSLTVKDFEDDHHLNYKGAKKFTILVDSVINLH